jgi:5'-nucleotidase
MPQSQSERDLKPMKRIAVDMDQVLADTVKYGLNLFNAEFKRDLTPQDFYGKSFSDVIGAEHLPRIREYLNDESFSANLEYMSGAPQTVQALSDRYEVFVASSAMGSPSSLRAKYDWLRRYFPFVPPSRIVFCGDKSILAADYLIDDSIRHLANFRGEGIIFTAPHNVCETRFRRVNNWEEVRALFLS